jgi:hypothetical protein
MCSDMTQQNNAATKYTNLGPVSVCTDVTSRCYSVTIVVTSLLRLIPIETDLSRALPVEYSRLTSAATYHDAFALFGP